jgi:hypothetical protein
MLAAPEEVKAEHKEREEREGGGGGGGVNKKNKDVAEKGEGR